MANKSSQKSKTPQWLSIAAIVLVVILALTLVLSLLTGGMRDWSKFKPSPEAGVDGGAVITPGEDAEDGQGNKLSLTVYEIPRDQYEKYGIAPITETAYTVTATVTGESLTAEQKKVTWGAAEFKDPSSEWANGKEVSTYVTATPDGNRITVSCLQAFGEQIIVKCSSSAVPGVSKDLTIDYARSLESYIQSESSGTDQKGLVNQYSLLHNMAKNADEGLNMVADYLFGTTATEAGHGTDLPQFMSKLDSFDKPIEATLTVGLKYGGSVIYHIYLDIEVEPLPASVDSVELSEETVTFTGEDVL